MLRYLRLYLHFMEFSFGRAMEFRLDFYFRIAMDSVFYLVTIGFFQVLYMHNSEVGGWTEPQTMIFVVGFLFVDALQMTLFSNNMWVFPLLVNKGDLDYYLVRPISAFFVLNFRDFAVNSFINLIMAVGLIFWAFWRYPEPLGLLPTLNYIVLIISGTFLHHLMRLVFVIPVFWTQSSRGFDTLFWSFTKFAERPHRIYTGVTRLIFLTVMPFGVIASLPAETLFSENPVPISLYCIVLLGVYFTGVLWFWRLALRNYSSASS